MKPKYDNTKARKDHLKMTFLMHEAKPEHNLIITIHQVALIIFSEFVIGMWEYMPLSLNVFLECLQIGVILLPRISQLTMCTC